MGAWTTFRENKQSSKHPLLQTKKSIQKCLRIWFWYKWTRLHKNQKTYFQKRILNQVKNDVCFYSLEKYDRSKGPYFYHVTADEKTHTSAVFEFDPCLLLEYLHTQMRENENDSNPKLSNPFSKIPFNVVELRRINKLAQEKNPQIEPLDLTPFLPDPFVHPVHIQVLNEIFSTTIQNQMQQASLQQCFQQNPSEMMQFIQTQIDAPSEQKDRAWFQFMGALTRLVARRFERVNSSQPQWGTSANDDKNDDPDYVPHPYSTVSQTRVYPTRSGVGYGRFRWNVVDSSHQTRRQTAQNRFENTRPPNEHNEGGIIDFQIPYGRQ